MFRFLEKAGWFVRRFLRAVTLASMTALQITKLRRGVPRRQRAA